MPSPVLDLRTARRWAVTARVMLAGARDRIDALNVFPVADGDTGTNMYLTFDAALDFVRGQFQLGAGTDRLDEGLRLIARGMLLGARGNSGVILSQLTRGLSEAVGPDVEAAGPEEIALAFETAARTAWDALAAPVEGTILTVARAAAEGARAAVDRGRPLYGEPDDQLLVGHVVSEALSEAQQALADTPRLLPALAVAGVVDAGGAGLVLVIEALQAVLEDRPHLAVDDLPTWWQQPTATPDLPGSASCASGPGAPGAAGELDGEVEVMFLLTESDAERADRLRAHLSRIGSSVVVGGGPQDYQVHVHLDDPRLAVEAGSLAGVVVDVRLTSLADGTALPAARLSHGAASQGRSDAPPVEPPPIAVVACGLGEGVHDLLVRAGAQVVPSGPRHRASAGQLLAAMRASGARDVVVLPNDRDTVLVAQAAAEEATREGIAAHVVPTGTLVQGLAALAVLDPSGRPAQVLAAMADAARACRPGALTRAERDAETPVGHCRTGQWLGIVDGDIVAVGDDLEPVAAVVLDGLWHEAAEVLTVLTGARAEPGGLATLLAEVETRHTGAEIVVIDGGQPTYPYLLGVE
ncbi:DAK2 domain-containing protein [Ornithinimicrobium tianjinense]|uniref:Dihydroxyacetone kinase n=1 Tax=Ornithinimicrobium tianjinense TaxID=1195761 RepID=A0A917BMG2_9MICO|nr:DAK2 domain-containing protein [Ornithinimicrobium tianjinense]GGF50466.1 dihydroxyacetone kinase [Ornithinimicrobium tianjinense]